MTTAFTAVDGSIPLNILADDGPLKQVFRAWNERRAMCGLTMYKYDSSGYHVVSDMEQAVISGGVNLQSRDFWRQLQEIPVTDFINHNRADELQGFVGTIDRLCYADAAEVWAGIGAPHFRRFRQLTGGAELPEYGFIEAGDVIGLHLLHDLAAYLSALDWVYIFAAYGTAALARTWETGVEGSCSAVDTAAKALYATGTWATVDPYGLFYSMNATVNRTAAWVESGSFYRREITRVPGPSSEFASGLGLTGEYDVYAQTLNQGSADPDDPGYAAFQGRAVGHSYKIATAQPFDTEDGHSEGVFDWNLDYPTMQFSFSCPGTGTYNFQFGHARAVVKPAWTNRGLAE